MSAGFAKHALYRAKVQILVVPCHDTGSSGLALLASEGCRSPPTPQHHYPNANVLIDSCDSALHDMESANQIFRFTFVNVCR
jgi:hypothetical protein